MIPIYVDPNDRQRIEQRFMNRSQLNNPQVQRAVLEIIEAVRTQGDTALFAYTEAFDHVTLNTQTVRVSQQEIDRAYTLVDPGLLDVIRRAADNIRCFHERQLQQTWLDVQNDRILGQMIRPLRRVGIYAPGGTAAYPSSVLMNLIPAKVAGVPQIILATPPGRDGYAWPMTVVCAHEVGVEIIYKIGGAQAIAALAFGTASIPKVDKITGPGNLYVANAKRAVFGYVGIDSIAGPSEVVVVADHTANPRFVAADLLSQAEHNGDEAVVLITDSPALGDAVAQEIQMQLATLPRRDIAQKSLDAYGAILITQSLDKAMEWANRIAPEHLELAVSDPLMWLSKVENAGSIFLGHQTPESAGDYYAGPNHILPTSGTARFFSPLGVEDFMKRSSILYYQRAALCHDAGDIMEFARAEGFEAHARAVEVRIQRQQEE